MQLNYKIQGHGQPVILLHGLFGSLDNLGVLARAFSDNYQTIQVDLRNHGHSFWSDEMNYSLMAHDVLALIDSLSLNNVILLGHSMGGKVAMELTKIIPHQIAQIIILDIAPVAYSDSELSLVFNELNQVFEQNLHDKATIHAFLGQNLSEPTTQFLLKSYKDGKWLFNFSALKSNLPNILSWQAGEPYFKPILFLKGEHSNYICQKQTAEMLQQFPYALIQTIANAGHNVHFENPEQVISLVKKWVA
ncbi:alpha/beta fold hydrolase [Orbaceae bacterium ac157xtp]